MASEARPRLLVIDDDVSLAEALTALLEHGGYRVSTAATSDAALAAVRRESIDLALLDLRLGGESGIDLLPQLKAARPEMSVIMITAAGSIEVAVAAMQSGADSFLVKPVEPQRLLAIVAKGCEARLLRRKSLQLGRLAARQGEGVAGDSRPMREALALAAAVAPRDTTVLLTGETGTGKGLVARYIHDLSPRRGEPFVELNCAGLQRDLTESELFGHERGAFTGASDRKIGLFEAADGGSLFLDEIGEMDLAVQAKLLKVIEERRFRRVGGTSEIETDARVIAATHRDLSREVGAARFREDLYFRLNVFTIPLPPLRDRGEDIVPLALRYLRQFRPAAVVDPAIRPEATVLLEAYHWPGNVRELRNVMERASILCPPGAAVGPEHLPPLAAAPRSLPASVAGGEPLTLDEIEQRYLATALRAHKGNIQATARELGISRGTLYRKVKKYGIAVTDG